MVIYLNSKVYTVLALTFKFFTICLEEITLEGCFGAVSHHPNTNKIIKTALKQKHLRCQQFVIICSTLFSISCCYLHKAVNKCILRTITSLLCKTKHNNKYTNHVLVLTEKDVPTSLAQNELDVKEGDGKNSNI